MPTTAAIAWYASSPCTTRLVIRGASTVIRKSNPAVESGARTGTDPAATPTRIISRKAWCSGTSGKRYIPALPQQRPTARVLVVSRNFHHSVLNSLSRTRLKRGTRAARSTMSANMTDIQRKSTK